MILLFQEDGELRCSSGHPDLSKTSQALYCSKQTWLFPVPFPFIPEVGIWKSPILQMRRLRPGRERESPPPHSSGTGALVASLANERESRFSR